MKLLSYLTLLYSCYGLLFVVKVIEERNVPILLTQHALSPNFHLLNSRIYIEEEDAYGRSLYQLKLGIADIERIQAEVDPESKALIGAALGRLKAVYTHMKIYGPDLDMLNESSIEVLLALTFAQVKSAEYFLEQDHIKKVRRLLRIGMYHIKKALHVSEGDKKDYEVYIYTEMNEIVKNRELSTQEISEKLTTILSEIEDLEVSFHN